MNLRIGKYLQHNVWKIENTVVKTGSNVRLTEALSMMFVRQTTSIPVPRVLDVFTREDQVYLVMEYIKGKSLQSAWRSLTPEQRSNICLELKGYLQQLRNLTPPHPGVVEAIDGSACFDSRLQGLFGPFISVDEFHSHFSHDVILAHPDRFPEYQEGFKRIAGKQYRTVFSHGDLGFYNVLVRKGKIAAIIDWEFAAWYPEYWEYTRSHSSNSDHREVRQLLSDGALMDVYAEELVVDKLLEKLFVRC